ncbi:M56 family metallopeptidase [Bradyrhizobium sp.]|uniref:M56 family metallopeptidase n=1 Tax=Bradyrhizobium sp. TaxID=376 RepID=UPI0039E4DCE3
MLAWMTYVNLVSLFLGLAALSFERSARLRKTNTRWLWGGSLLASLIVPFAISSVSVQVPLLTTVGDPAASTKTVVLRQMTLPQLSPSEWIAESVGDVADVGGLDAALQTVWIAASASLLLAIVASTLHLAWRRRHWTSENISGVSVYISEDTGPAIVGLFSPRIVLPRWLMTATRAEQKLVLAHEDAHLEAHDAQLLAVALFLLVCMPWNLPLWRQIRRLRCAIEIDCDARVLRRGHAMRRYGELLVAIGEKQQANVAVVAAMSESFLEQRIRHMLRRRAKWAGLATAVLVCAGTTLVAVAAHVSPPNIGGARQPVSLNASTLDSYTGYYRLGDNAVLSVTRVGDQLMTQSTGHRSVPVYPLSKTTFAAKASDAQITFIVDASGGNPSAISRQGGRDLLLARIDEETAQQIAARVDRKVRSQSASPETEVALRRLLDGIAGGAPRYDEMTPALADATRDQLAKLKAASVQLGDVRSIAFLGVGSKGEDVYSVRHDRGTSRWRIALDLNGLLSTALVSAGP